MRLRIENRADASDDLHDTVALYAMVIHGDFRRRHPPNDPEDTILSLGDGRHVVAGTVSTHTKPVDEWEITGDLRQFEQTASSTTVIFRDGQQVQPGEIGPHTDRPDFPTGPAGGLATHRLDLDGAGLTPAGQYAYLLDGEFLERDDPGEIALRVADGWYVMCGHIAGGTDRQRFAGRVERVATGGASLDITLDGRRASWLDVVDRTGGAGRVPPPITDPSGGVDPVLVAAGVAAGGGLVATVWYADLLPLEST